MGEVTLESPGTKALGSVCSEFKCMWLIWGKSVKTTGPALSRLNVGHLNL